MIQATLVKLLRFALRALEAPKGKWLATARHDVQRTVAAHRYVAGVTPIKHSAQAIMMAACYELTHIPRCHVRGQANRYALGYTSA